MSETVVVTRKIQLLIDKKDPEEVTAIRHQIYEWQDICFRAANYIFTHRYVQERMQDFVYLTDGIKLKLADAAKDEDGIFKTSKENTTYQMLSARYKGKLPMNMLSALNHSLAQYYNSERKQYWTGERSLRNYKRDIALPVPSAEFKMKLGEDGKEFKFSIFKIPFRTYLGRDRNDKRHMLGRALVGTLKMGVGHLKPEKGRFYYYATFHIEKEKHPLDESIIAEASLSPEIPVTVKIGKEQFQIGTKEEYLHRRLAIQAALRRAQKSSPYNRGGKGRKRKLKAAEDYMQLEKRYTEQKLHLYSRRLIDLCVKHQAATLLLVNQQQKEETAKEDEFLLRNWGFSGLKSKITYKANKAGIMVIEE